MAGCQQPKQAASAWLLINFKKNVPVTYHFVSDRDIIIDLTGGSAEKKTKPQTITEKLDMVVTYTPTEVDPFGLTTLVAECKSARVSRSSVSGRQPARDAIENLVGKTFTFTLSPTGDIADDADMRRVLSEVGKTAFVRDETRRIKNPDMLCDFIPMQLQLWDAVSTVEEPLTGMKPGQTWQVKQWIPWPAPVPNMPMRLTTYTLDSFITEDTNPQKAVIKSAYALADPEGRRFPYPYEEGMFQMRGIMGFLRNYRYVSLEGSGTHIFNMEKGLLERNEQQYTLNVNAAFLLPLGGSQPVLTVKQKILIEQVQSP